MNKQLIEKLIEKADVLAEQEWHRLAQSTDGMPAYKDLFNQKFAELIVRECADYADMAQDAGCEYAGDYVAEAMGYGEEEGVTEWRAK